MMKTTSVILLAMMLTSTAYAFFTTSDDCLANKRSKVSITTMEGGGKYAAASSSQQESSRRLFPDIIQAVQTILSSSANNNQTASSITLADYGAADGLTTRYLLEHITDNIPNNNVKIDVMVNDQDTNDWDSCAHNLSPIGKLKNCRGRNPNGDACQDTREEDRKHNNIELFANPGSFTKQLLPDHSVDIAISSMAYHWLSSPTTNLPLPGRFTFHNNSTDPAIAAAWHQHAANDWRNICQSRHAELKPGGYFIASVPCMETNGRYTYDELFTTVFDPILDRWVEEGILDATERQKVFVPTVARTVAEFEAGMEEYFDIVKIDEVIMANPYLNGVNLDSEQERQMFAQRYTDSIFAWAHTMLLNAFGGDEKLVNKFRSQLIEGIAARAENFDNDFVYATIVARRH